MRAVDGRRRRRRHNHVAGGLKRQIERFRRAGKKVHQAGNAIVHDRTERAREVPRAQQRVDRRQVIAVRVIQHERAVQACIAGDSELGCAIRPDGDIQRAAGALAVAALDRERADRTAGTDGAVVDDVPIDRAVPRKRSMRVYGDIACDTCIGMGGIADLQNAAVDHGRTAIGILAIENENAAPRLRQTAAAGNSVGPDGIVTGGIDRPIHVEAARSAHGCTRVDEPASIDAGIAQRRRGGEDGLHHLFGGHERKGLLHKGQRTGNNRRGHRSA